MPARMYSLIKKKYMCIKMIDKLTSKSFKILTYAIGVVAV